MYFNTYKPAAKNCQTARAFHTFNAVRNFCGKAEPRFSDYAAYRWTHSLPARERHAIIYDMEAQTQWELSLKAEWAEIRKLVREAGQPLHRQYVVYFAIIDGGVKCGETNNIVQRYSVINNATPIAKMWYMEVDSKENAKTAEHALHNVFDHARCMNRQQGKKDYYECDSDKAAKFIAANAQKFYNAIAAALEEE